MQQDSGYRRQRQGRLAITATLLLSLAGTRFAAIAAGLSTLGQARPASAPILRLSGDTVADAGLVDPLQQSDAVHLYTLKNATSAVLKVAGLRGTCGCEHMAMYSGGHEQATLTLQPGAEFQALVGVRVQGQPPGPLSKSVSVLGGPSGTETLATLTLTFRVRQPTAFEPVHLDLGDIPAGGSASTMVKLHIDRMPQWKTVIPPTLSADTPVLSASLVGDPIPETRDGKAGASVTYKVTLGRMSMLGPYNASLRTTWPQGLVGAPPATSLPVSFRIIGNLAVVPQALNFGAVSRGASVTRSFVVIGKSLDDLKSAIVSVSNASVQVHGVSNCHPYRDGASGVVTATLAPQAPGPVSAAVTVRAADGEMVQLPVTAFVAQ